MRLNWMIAMALVVSLSACQSMPWKNDSAETLETEDGYEAPLLPEPGLALSTSQRFSDVPLPEGAKQDLERTYVFESSTLKIGRMVYTIREPVNDLAQFYIKEAPIANWRLSNVTQADGAELTFEKTGSRLQVSIQPGSVTRGGSLLILHLTPTDR